MQPEGELVTFYTFLPIFHFNSLNISLIFHKLQAITRVCYDIEDGLSDSTIELRQVINDFRVKYHVE